MFVGTNEVNAINSRTVERVEIIESVPQFATEDATIASVTPLPVYTVTPGPTSTLPPSNTPGPTDQPTGIYTLTPVPTVATLVPTFTPQPTGVYVPEETELPRSILILMGVTAGVVVLVLIYGLFLWIRARRRAAKR